VKAKSAAAAITEQRRKFISDAFHTLNQPLTGLHCGLEIALHKAQKADEYRKRLQEGLVQAGEVMTLVRAIRELADAADPGERYGTVSVSLLLVQLKSDLEVVSATSGVEVDVDCPPEIRLLVDPSKFLRCLGSLVSAEMEALNSAAKLRLTVVRKNDVVVEIKSSGERKLRDPEQALSLDEKVAEIRRVTACSYIWTLGGDFETDSTGMTITLPAEG
jgi:signal transduction histidine kinase